ncbi:MAG TPA: tetratricopeptide repeat protein [Thermoanaerobaculia bacterium]|jgi:tetratricopeptide (TPR) repeat protein
MRSEETGRTDAAFEELRNRGLRAIETGELEEAAESFAAALRLAREQGDLKRIDLALCNWAAAVIELGRGDGEISRLREVLLRNSDPVNCRMAAYDIARHYELKKNYKKALFYARITRDRSEVLGRRDWLASSHNLIGNTLLAESFLEEACAEYEKALELIPAEPSPARGQILDNLGYCRTLQGRHEEGYRLLYESLGLLRRFGARRHEISARLDLCFAHLETGRYRHAHRQGTAALLLAESLGESDSVKNALYLLGEVANLSGDLEAARGHFARLHRDFFPDAGYLPEFLLAVDIRRLVNLHA